MNLSDACDAKANDFDRDSSVFLQVVGWIVLMGGALFVPLCVFYYFKNRNSFERLRNRNTFLLLCFAAGIFFMNLNNGLRAIIGAKNYSCRAYYFLLHAQLIMLLQSSVIRLLSLLWRVTFNYDLIEETYSALVAGDLVLSTGAARFVGRSSRRGKNKRKAKGYYEDVFRDAQVTSLAPDEPDKGAKTKPKDLSSFQKFMFKVFCWTPSRDLPKSLVYSQFLASKYFASMLFIVSATILLFFSFMFSFIDFPVGEDCNGCSRALSNEDGISLSTLYGNLYNVTVGVYALISLYRVRKIPDSLGIKKELIFMGILLLINIFLVFTFSEVFEDTERNGEFDFTLITPFLVFFIGLYMFPYQVYLARKGVDNNIDPDAALKDILSSNKGMKAFALYLSTNLSLETLYFYQAATEWKRTYTEYFRKESKQSALNIYATYIDDEAFLLINISSACRQDIETQIREEIVPDDIFDRATQEMYALMATDIFARFKKSTYYKAFTNELQNN